LTKSQKEILLALTKNEVSYYGGATTNLVRIGAKKTNKAMLEKMKKLGLIKIGPLPGRNYNSYLPNLERTEVQKLLKTET